LAFSDDAAITQKDAVKTYTDLGIIKGHDNGNFDPAASLTRAEMAKMIAMIEVGGQKQIASGMVLTSSALGLVPMVQLTTIPSKQSITGDK